MQRRREWLAVNEDHVVALAIPVELGRIAQVFNIEVAADVLPAPLGFEQDVIAVGAQVLTFKLKGAVAETGVGDAVARVLPPPLRVQATQVVVQ